jgi:hypothetical protein
VGIKRNGSVGKLHAVKSRCVVSVQDRDISLFPSFPDSGWRIRVEDFQDTDSKGIIKSTVVVCGVFRYRKMG